MVIYKICDSHSLSLSTSHEKYPLTLEEKIFVLTDESHGLLSLRICIFALFAFFLFFPLSFLQGLSYLMRGNSYGRSKIVHTLWTVATPLDCNLQSSSYKSWEIFISWKTILADSMFASRQQPQQTLCLLSYIEWKTSFLKSSFPNTYPQIA